MAEIVKNLSACNVEDLGLILRLETNTIDRVFFFFFLSVHVSTRHDGTVLEQEKIEQKTYRGNLNHRILYKQ